MALEGEALGDARDRVTAMIRGCGDGTDQFEVIVYLLAVFALNQEDPDAAMDALAASAKSYVPDLRKKAAN